jgi:hypothetical protein
VSVGRWCARFAEGIQGGIGNGRDGALADQLVDVQRGRVTRVLRPTPKRGPR